MVCGDMMNKRKLKSICAGGLVLSLVLASPSATALGCGGKPAPDIVGSTWLNSVPLSLAGLRNKVVLVEFWTLGCSNCRNVEPYIKKWHEKYARQGLVVVGVHSPEFDYEKEIDRVRGYVQEHSIRHAVVIDNDFAIWNRFGNRYWPAMYLIDKTGAVCSIQIGEGGYEKTERQIRQLLEDR